MALADGLGIGKVGDLDTTAIKYCIWRHNIWWARYEIFLNLSTEFDHEILDANFQEFAN